MLTLPTAEGTARSFGLALAFVCAAVAGACAPDGEMDPGESTELLPADSMSAAKAPVTPESSKVGAAGSAPLMEAEPFTVANSNLGGAAGSAPLMEARPTAEGLGAGEAEPQVGEPQVGEPQGGAPQVGDAGGGVAGSGGTGAGAGGQGNLGVGGEPLTGAGEVPLTGTGGSTVTDEMDRGILPTVWPIAAPRSVLGLPTEVSGSPTPRTDDGVYSVVFDGEEDRMLVESNPVFGATEFTLEVVFRPGGGDFSLAKAQQRLVHIEEAGNPGQRIELGVHLDEEDHWALAVTVQAGGSELTLVDPMLRYRDEAWAHAAITYKDQVLTTYVRGKRELSGPLDYQPLAESAKTSIGAGMGSTDWFNGEISYIAVISRAVPPEEFLLVSRAEED